MTAPRCSVFCAVSLDGFIARKDGSLDWLMGSDPNDLNPPPDTGYDAFMDTIDWVVLGRNTFDVVLKTSDKWFYRKPVFVLTHRRLAVPPSLNGKVERGDYAPAALLDMMEKRGAKRLYIDGGKTVRSFLEAGLIDDLTITQIPTLIGDGLPLFGHLPNDIKLATESSRVITGGAVQTVYRVVR